MKCDVSDLFHSCLQLSGSLVLAVGLWLRFDPNTANLLAENDALSTSSLVSWKRTLKPTSHVYITVFVGFINLYKAKPYYRVRNADFQELLGEETGHVDIWMRDTVKKKKKRPCDQHIKWPTKVSFLFLHH